MLKEERHNVYTAPNFAIGQSLFVWDPLKISCHTINTTHQFDLLNLWSFVDVPLIFSCSADHGCGRSDLRAEKIIIIIMLD